MKYKVGDRVAIDFNDFDVKPYCLGLIFHQRMFLQRAGFLKGNITSIKSRKYLFFKMKKPVYEIDYCFKTTEIKPLITLPAIIN